MWQASPADEVPCTPPQTTRMQGYVEATPEHPLEAASAAAFASSLPGSGGGSSDNGDGSSQGGFNSRTFVTQAQANSAASASARAAASRSSLEELSERNIGGSDRGGEDGGVSSRVGSPPSLMHGVSHQPQAPSIV